MRRDEGQCVNSLEEKTMLNTNYVVVYPQSTLTLRMFFPNHVVVEFFGFFSYGFKPQLQPC